MRISRMPILKGDKTTAAERAAAAKERLNASRKRDRQAAKRERKGITAPTQYELAGASLRPSRGNQISHNKAGRQFYKPLEEIGGRRRMTRRRKC